MRKLNISKKLERILRISKHYDDVQFHLQKAKTGLCSNNPDLFEEEIKKAIIESEKGYSEVYSFGTSTIGNSLSLRTLKKETLEVSGISIEKLENDVIRITMPPILPFHYYKKIKYSSAKNNEEVFVELIKKTNLFIDMLEEKIKEYLEENPEDFGRYSQYTLYFLNVFERGFYQDRIPDTDNYSYKNITDIISENFCSSDSFNEADIFLKSDIGDYTHTEIYIIPQQFWFNVFKCAMMKDKDPSYRKSTNSKGRKIA